MPKFKYLLQREGVWYYRRPVPSDIREAYGKQVISTSLHTNDFDEAKRLAHKKNVKYDEKFDRYRTDDSDEPVEQTLDSISIKQACDAIFKKIIEDDFEYRADIFARANADEDAFYDEKIIPLPDTEYFYLLTQEFVALREMLSYVFRHDLKARLEKAQLFFNSGDYAINGNSKLAYGLLKAEIRAIESLLSKSSSEAQIENDVGATKIVKVDNSPLFSDAKEIYIAETRQRKIPEKTIQSMESALRSFVEVAGDKPLTAYLKSEGASYKRALTKAPAHGKIRKDFKNLNIIEAGKRADGLGDIPRLSIVTVNDKLGMISAFFRWAQRNNDGVITNPVDGLKIKDTRSNREKRLPFTIEQLTKLFNAYIYTGSKSERHWIEPGDLILRDSSIFWVPLVGLFSGMRLGEIIQLSITDVCDKDGIKYFDINLDSKDKKLKNTSSIRQIPIHPELIRIGFLDFVTKKNGRLFSDYKKSKSGSWSDHFSKHFSRFRKNAGVDEGLVNFHSFRHGFEDACRNSGVTGDVMDAIQGHSQKGERGTYGQGFDIKTLNKSMRKIKYDGLDLSHLKT